MITLANGTQTMAKGIGSACPLPSLPLTFVLYVPDSPFNLISISKLIHNLNYSITFSQSSVTLQDRSTGRTIGIGPESQGLYYLSSTPSSTVYTSYFYSSYAMIMPWNISLPLSLTFYLLWDSSSIFLCLHSTTKWGD